LVFKYLKLDTDYLEKYKKKLYHESNIENNEIRSANVFLFLFIILTILEHEKNNDQDGK